MKRIVRLTENDIRKMIKQALNEVDWKTKANVAKERARRYDLSQDEEDFNKYWEDKKMADKAFSDEFIYPYQYDTLGDKFKGKHSATFDGTLPLTRTDKMAYGAIKGRNKSGNTIMSTDKGAYFGPNGYTKPSSFFRDKEVGDAYERANDELWDYSNGEYEYIPYKDGGSGWTKKNQDSLDEAVRRAIKKYIK